jgi:hypothetical protein
MNLVPLDVDYITYLKGSIQQYFLKCRKGNSDYKRFKKFEKARAKVEEQFDLIKLMKRVGKLNIVKKLVLERHHMKLIKFSHYNTIMTDTSDTDTEKNFPKEWQTTLRSLGYLKKVVEGSAKGDHLDHEVLKLIISRKVLGKLMNGTEFGMKNQLANLFKNGGSTKDGYD